jgi:hypothetical protein
MCVRYPLLPCVDSYSMMLHVVLSGHGSEVVEVPAQQSVEVSVFTRSTVGGMFCIHDNDKKTTIIDDILVKNNDVSHDGAAEYDVAYSTLLTKVPIQGPIEIKIKANSLANRFSTHNYLLVFSFKNK